jgi:gliding motility associated protien GldN
MKAIAKHIAIAAALICSLGVVAQDDTTTQRSGATTVSRGQRTRPGQAAATSSSEVTTRAQLHLTGEASAASDADTRWMRVIYRELDLTADDENAALYYPEDIVDGNENLFRIMLRLLTSNQIAAYEYLDGREEFTDDKKINVGEMLARFDIPATQAKGYSEKNPLYTVEEADVPTNEVLSYYVIEQWRFDNRSNRMQTSVEAICPVMHRSGFYGEDAVKYPMFWMKMADLKPFLQKQYIFTDDDNNLQRYTYADFFTMNLYKGDIYKTRNLRNRSMAQLYEDPDDRRRAQDSIQNRLDHYADNLWVPTREELAAARAAADSTKVDSGAEEQVKERTSSRTKSSSRTSSRSKVKKEKTSTPKSSSSSSSSSATRSVRNRRK